VDQSDPGLPDGEDDFMLFDAAIGYRLPDRRGIISLEGRNLLDEDFSYQDDNFRTSDIRRSEYVPARVIFGRLTLNF
jgi:outer membrane receptor protein involved in Fe transport